MSMSRPAAAPAPSWSRPPQPQHIWSLDEIKQGHVVGTHALRGGSCTFGRVAGTVDIVTAHESCSRLHARIAFDQHGTPWLRDLSSANGTFVNNKRIPPEACGRVEEGGGQRKGSRGVVMYPGDAVRFGASTRLFVLEGPAEFERGAVKLKLKATEVAGSNPNMTPDCHERTENIGGCDWGMAEDAIPPEQEQPTPSSAQVVDQNSNLPPLPSMDKFFYDSTYKITDALRKVHSQYNAKLHKLHHIQTESQRILQKENSMELTDGQRGQLGRNSERIATLEKEVGNLKERIESGMHLAIHGKSRPKRNARPTEEYGDDDDVDDFYDRTTSAKRPRTDAIESEASLICKWKSLLRALDQHQQATSRATRRCEALQRDIDDPSNKEEDEDTFFLRNDMSLAQEDLAKARTGADDTEKEFDEVEKLLTIVNPKLRWDRKAGWIGTKDVETRKEEVVATEEEDSRTMPPPSSSTMPPPPPVFAVTASSSGSVFPEQMPPSASSEHEESTCNAIPTRTCSGESGVPTTKQKKRIGPMRPSPTSVQGTLATLTQAVSQPKPPPTGARTLPPGHGQKKTTVAVMSNPFDPRKDEWKAPEGQDGSGRTALRDKFKGRY